MRAYGRYRTERFALITTFFSPHAFLTGSPHSADPWAPAHTGAAPWGEQSCDWQQGGRSRSPPHPGEPGQKFHLWLPESHTCKPILKRISTSLWPGKDPAWPCRKEHTHLLGHWLQRGQLPRHKATGLSTFLFSYFCINFSFSWLFSVQWPLEFGFFDSWRDAQKTHSASKEIHNLAFKGNSIKWYGCSLILYLTSELSSHLLAPKRLNKRSSKESFKGTVGKKKPAPHPTFLPTQSRRLSGEGRIHTQTLWKGGNATEATDVEATRAASHSQLLNLYTSRINCINSGV